MDNRYQALAKVLINHSTELKAGERLLIDAFDVPENMILALIREARTKGALPFVNYHHARTSRELMLYAETPQYETLAKYSLAQMKEMDAYIALRGADNIFEQSDVPTERASLAIKLLRPVLNYRVNETKWCVLRWPTPAMAQQAKTSTEAFEDFYFKVCTLDYSKLIPGMEALNKRMTEASNVHIIGNGTDLRFSIKGIPVISCGGRHNIPDGEVFTAPVRDSVQGYIHYTAPTVYQGTSFENIRLDFKDGKIIKATGSNEAKLNEILDSDEGARYIGEFAIGFNPHITEPMQDILFDEKIAGSFHFTPGQAYEQADNGNRSQVHWDLVNIQRPEYGGGEIYFDGVCIRRDGIFLPEDLQQLNPDQLLAAT